MGLRALEVEVLDSSGKHLATHPRAYGQASTNSEDPSMHVFCQIEVVQNGVSIQSEKAAGFSPVERKDPPPLLFGFYPIRAWVRLYDSPSNLIILP